MDIDSTEIDVQQADPDVPQQTDDDDVPPTRLICDYDSPTKYNTRHGITPPTSTAGYAIKSSMLAMVQQSKFKGNPDEDPIEHLDHFDKVCALTRQEGISEDGFKLRLFPFTLEGQANHWEKTLKPGSITTWEQCKGAFLKKFFSPSRTAKLRQDIITFAQGDQEKFSAAWERLKSYTIKCPHHGFSVSTLLNLLYRGTTMQYKSLLDAASKGLFVGLDEDEGLRLVENLATSVEQYDIHSVSTSPQQTVPKEVLTIQAQLNAFINGQPHQGQVDAKETHQQQAQQNFS